MISVHPLFAGFAGAPLDQLGMALGFELLAEARPGQLPAELSFCDHARLSMSGDLAGYRFAGGWQAGSQHCLLFARPTNHRADQLWHAAQHFF